MVSNQRLEEMLVVQEVADECINCYSAMENECPGEPPTMCNHCAFELILEMARELLELRQREEWVKVSERLPEDRIEVDVWFDVYASPMSFGMSDTWREPNAYRKDGKWVHRYHGEEAELNARYITHWRLLPTPPKEGL